MVDEETPLLNPALAALLVPFILSSPVPQAHNYTLITALDQRQDYYYQVGRFLSWMCTCLYLSSRLPQIYWNFKRRSVEGLAIVMFFCALMGNVTYACSILIKSLEPEYIWGSLPFLLGSGGTVLFDFIIFTQYAIYTRN